MSLFLFSKRQKTAAHQHKKTKEERKKKRRPLGGGGGGGVLGAPQNTRRGRDEREVERHDAQRSSSSALAVREGVEGASAGCLARTIVECLCGSFLGGDDDDDDDDNNDHDETKKTRKTNGRKRFSSDRGRTMMRLFAEDFLYFSLVSLVNTTNDARSERNHLRLCPSRKDTR